jgi:hypothetical protein
MAVRYGLSYRDMKELLAELGVEVDHVTIYRWVHRFAPLFADAARCARHSPATAGSLTNLRQSSRRMALRLPGRRSAPTSHRRARLSTP